MVAADVIGRTALMSAGNTPNPIAGSSQIDSAIEKAAWRGTTKSAHRDWTAGSRQMETQAAPNRLRGRAGRRQYRQRAGNPLADRAHGAMP
jgi:hypothetical protein